MVKQIGSGKSATYYDTVKETKVSYRQYKNYQSQQQGYRNYYEKSKEKDKSWDIFNRILKNPDNRGDSEQYQTFKQTVKGHPQMIKDCEEVAESYEAGEMTDTERYAALLAILGYNMGRSTIDIALNR
jgi:hypothetical protein